MEIKISSNSGTQQKEKEKTKKGMLEVKNVQIKESLIAGTNLSC